MRMRKVNQGFRPNAESVEERVLTTTGISEAVAHVGIAAERFTLAERREQLLERRQEILVRREQILELRQERLDHRGGHAASLESVRALDSPPPIGPGLGKGLVRLNLPYNHTDYGVISIWNNTSTRITILVGADTHQNGQLAPYTIFPGRTQSYFAYSTINGNPPVFTVSVNSQQQPYELTKVNVVYQPNGYFAPAKAGYPYSVNFGVNGYYLSYI